MSTEKVNDTGEDDISYDYDEANAVKADDAASRLTDNGAFVGVFKSAEAVKSDKTGTHGIAFVFDSPGNGNAEFTLWTRKADGSDVFGKAQVDAIMFLMGLKGLKGVTAKVQRWAENDKGDREKMEVDGKVFPDLCNRPIGVVLQKELYSGKNGSGERMNLYGLFQPETKLMMSEIKERKTTPVKLERLLKGLKTKDSRKAQADEPAQPAIGAGAGDY